MPKQLRGKDYYLIYFSDRHITFDYYDNGDCVVHNIVAARNTVVVRMPLPEERVARFVFTGYLKNKNAKD